MDRRSTALRSVSQMALRQCLLERCASLTWEMLQPPLVRCDSVQFPCFSSSVFLNCHIKLLLSIRILIFDRVSGVRASSINISLSAKAHKPLIGNVSPEPGVG